MKIENNRELEEFINENPHLIFETNKMKQNLLTYKQLNYKPVMKSVEALWYWGETRLGKSWKAIKDADFDPKGDMTGLYFKSHNKWWDNYNNEDVVMLDEFNLNDAVWIVTHLKQWTDALPMSLEVKGG